MLSKLHMHIGQMVNLVMLGDQSFSAYLLKGLFGFVLLSVIRSIDNITLPIDSFFSFAGLMAKK